MCGRYTNTKSVEAIEERFSPKVTTLQMRLPKFNIAPSQDAPVIVNQNEGKKLTQFRWGLIPSWSKEPSIGYKMINARVETLKEKVSFKRLLKNQRCLVVSDGYYEWKQNGSKKTPFRINFESGELFSFAGLWDEWKDSTGLPVLTFTIITMSSEDSESVKSIHHRMPLILPRSEEEKWIDPSIDAYVTLNLAMEKTSTLKLNSYPVSAFVNSPKNEGSQCIEPVISFS